MENLFRQGAASRGVNAFLIFAALAVSAIPVRADQSIYTDSLQNGWNNWSWSSTINLSQTSPVHGGANSMGVKLTAAWAAVLEKLAPVAAAAAAACSGSREATMTEWP